ncbi:MAG: sulfatase-like hydrolase/transferase [Myxococcota bacterium]
MKQTIAITLASIVGWALCQPVQAQTPANNIVLIVADDIGTDQLRMYGINPNAPATPHLDALAADGQVYRQAWSNPTCSPTRASLYTGRHAFRHGVGGAITNVDTDPELQPTETTLPEVLNSVGYTNALVGKWHLGDVNAEANPCLAPSVHGWSVFRGDVAAAVPDHYDWPKCIDASSVASNTWSATDNVNDALAFIRNHTQGPFMLTVAFNVPHTPWQIPPSGFVSSGRCPASGRVTVLNRDCYRAMIENMDSEIGRLLAGIDPQTTTVMFVGDNGTPIQGVARGTYPPNQAKGSIYEGGVRVPMIIRGPQVTDRGWVEAPVNVLDLFATSIDLAGASLPPNLQVDAVSLRPYFSAKSRPPLKNTVYTEGFMGSDDCSFGDAAAIRNARYKLVRISCVKDELYDLHEDPFESTNLLNEELTSNQERAYRSLSDAMVALRGR